jgi:Sec7-like guanine-nucleotide exchange factor
MAETDLTTTIAAIANTGASLSIKLHTFSETVATASSDIKNIARDVSLTSSVLGQLGTILKVEGEAESPAQLPSGSAIQTAQDAVNECEVVFKEIDDVLAKATASVAKRWPKKGGKVALSPGDRLKWPFLQPRVVLLRGNLERVKSMILLLVNVLSYAEQQRKA